MIRVEFRHITDAKPLNRNNELLSARERSFYEQMRFKLEDKVNDRLRVLREELRGKKVRLVIPVNNYYDLDPIRYYSLENCEEDLEYRIKYLLGEPD